MARCSFHHELLLAVEFTPMGAVVDCLRCGDTLHISENSLAENYFYAHHNSEEGPERDRDFFILATLLPEDL